MKCEDAEKLAFTECRYGKQHRPIYVIEQGDDDYSVGGPDYAERNASFVRGVCYMDAATGVTTFTPYPDGIVGPFCFRHGLPMKGKGYKGRPLCIPCRYSLPTEQENGSPLTYNVEISGGRGPDTWHTEFQVTAHSFAQAYEKARAKCPDDPWAEQDIARIEVDA